LKSTYRGSWALLESIAGSKDLEEYRLHQRRET
jgi:hypothetical protein